MRARSQIPVQDCAYKLALYIVDPQRGVSGIGKGEFKLGTLVERIRVIYQTERIVFGHWLSTSNSGDILQWSVWSPRQS